MNEYVVLYFEFLEWIVNNPLQALVVLIVEFCAMYWLYYKTNKNKVLKVVFGTLFQPQNFVFNMVGMTLIGLELPRESACTKRAKRWKAHCGATHTGINTRWARQWRVYFATTICNILNKFDPNHC